MSPKSRTRKGARKYRSPRTAAPAPPLWVRLQVEDGTVPALAMEAGDLAAIHHIVLEKLPAEWQEDVGLVLVPFESWVPYAEWVGSLQSESRPDEAPLCDLSGQEQISRAT